MRTAIRREEHELDTLPLTAAGQAVMEERDQEASSPLMTPNDMPEVDSQQDTAYEHRLDRRTVRKLDFILLPFLALLFLLNSLDKSNIGNAETAGFTSDAGLTPSDLNLSLAYFFAFFVLLQPVGAALGRKYGMARWVPACMSLWGLCTILHIWVRRRWQLICLRVLIACLEAGFYPTTVSYLSLFYTRYEFAVRLGFFYGQTAVAGVLGGVLSWAVFSRFEKLPGVTRNVEGSWKSWEVLFVIEGCTTMAVALLGFFWLPHSAETAWFFNSRERVWAEQRIRLDHDNVTPKQRRRASIAVQQSMVEESETGTDNASKGDEDDETDNEPHHHLLGGPTITRQLSAVSAKSVTADTGLSRHDVLSAVLSYKIWHLLVCNILSAIPATAFSVFLPLVIKQLSPSLNLSPAASNLLSAPPFAFGALVLFLFTYWSDRSHQRLVPIFWGLGLLLIGLLMTVMVSHENYILRYASLCILLSGSFIASPLTVAWLTNNTPEPGKRAILLGINGWGNLAGVFSALLFTPGDKASGYIKPFTWTLVCVTASFIGFIMFWVLLVRENTWRENVTARWTDAENDREELLGDVELKDGGMAMPIMWIAEHLGLRRALMWLGWERSRRGDEKLTFRYSL
ncbi:hypothetical protein LTR62_005365 [Meristemomyces frigidus]|uniref:Major facilitator superfamily (MFS) profile domain-containing protein n=1 Tax=Meristemomyces frigidus TaxID=1508187 RepID=A0AAN7TEL2_9PEZI|nr:hypothetical protein LTR62_005365 [Meristemomyces frigidus]